MKYSMEHEHQHYVALPGPACNALKKTLPCSFEFGSHILKTAEGLVRLGSLSNYMEQLLLTCKAYCRCIS